MNLTLKTAKQSLKNFSLRKNSIECMKRLLEGGDKSVADRIRKTTAEVEAVELALASLPEEQRDLLDSFYVSRGTSVDGLCEKYCCSVSTVYRMCREALVSFTLSMFGGAE